MQKILRLLKAAYRTLREIEWNWSLLGFLGVGGKVTTVVSGVGTAVIAALQGWAAAPAIAVGMVVAAATTVVVAGARASRSPPAITAMESPKPKGTPLTTGAADSIKTWYHGGSGKEAVVGLWHVLNKAVHILPTSDLHRSFNPVVEIVRQRLKASYQQLDRLKATTGDDVATRAIQEAAEQYHFGVLLCAAMARTNPGTWTGQLKSEGEVADWRQAHENASENLRRLTAGDAFDNVRDRIIRQFSDYPSFDPTGGEEPLAKLVKIGRRTLNQES